MSRPRKQHYNLKQKLEKMRAAGLNPARPAESTNNLLPLPNRLQHILNILKSKPIKATDMLYLIMYDIENDKIRTLIARYLEKNGCIRIQKSVYLARSEAKKFEQIFQTLKEVQSFYNNHDSILLVPANTTDLRSMKIIGKDISLQTILDPPNTLFF